jgi:hypothetical protein
MYFYYGTDTTPIIELTLNLVPDSFSINWDSVFPFTGWKYANPDYDGTNDEYISIETTFSVTKKADVNIPNIYDVELYDIPPYSISGFVQTPVCHVLDKQVNGFILYLFYNRKEYRRYQSTTNTWSNLVIGTGNITSLYNATIYSTSLRVITNLGIYTFNGSSWALTLSGDFQSFDMSQPDNSIAASIIKDNGADSRIWPASGSTWVSSLSQVHDAKIPNTFSSREQTVISTNGRLIKYNNNYNLNDSLNLSIADIQNAFVLSKPALAGGSVKYALFVTTNNQNVPNKAILLGLLGVVDNLSIINLGEHDYVNNIYINKEQWTTGWRDNSTGISLILSKDGKIGYSLNLEKWRVETPLTSSNTWINLRKVL